MTPRDAVARLRQLGASLDVTDLPKVNQLHICKQVIPAKYADMMADMLPETVTLNGVLMTANDVPALVHFPSLRGIVAHSMDFASDLLRQLAEFANLESVAMSHASVTDADVATLANRSGLTSVHFAGTLLTDIALNTFGTLSGLELLDLRNTLVTNDGLQQLRDLRNLFTIDVRGTAVTMSGANRYRGAVANVLPDVEVLVGHNG